MWKALVFVLCATLMLLVGNRIAVGQAGSIGGTIGKTDKSASGGEDQTPTRIAPARHSGTNEKSKEGGCQRIIGTWRWPIGHDWVFNQDGSIHTTRGYDGKWKCDGGEVVITWSTNETDRLTISRAGDSFSNGSWTAKRQ